VTDPAAGAIRVLVVDDHGVVRRGIRSYLELVADVDVIGEAHGGQDAVDRVAQLAAVAEPPDVVLMDLVMPGMDGITATAAIKARCPRTAVVAMTSFAEAERVHAALEAGASGYLLKDAEADELAAAIRAAHRGDVHLDAGVAKRLTQSLVTPGAPSLRLLTDREREILALVAQGLSNQGIADRLAISERTARSHVSNILTKLGLTSRTQAALWALREGIASPPPAPDR
jgi:DNA-binding NarL/FixJ family response regulator